MEKKAGTGKRKYKIIAIYGSPREGGNSSIIMDSLLDGVMNNPLITGIDLKVEKIIASKLDISPCRECHNCSRTGECIIDDDMQEVYKSLINADFIAISSPVFFTSVSGDLKALIDRCQRFWALKYEHKKRIIEKDRCGVFMSVAGSSASTIFDCARKVIRAFFDVLYVRYLKDFVFYGIDNKGDVLKDTSALKELYEFGRGLDFK
ncbi:MAG: flavodoxin family protein [Actinobacteria bacterium]|nr:flavodoxin family protein [Actinomycetota bacterium]